MIRQLVAVSLVCVVATFLGPAQALAHGSGGGGGGGGGRTWWWRRRQRRRRA